MNTRPTVFLVDNEPNALKVMSAVIRDSFLYNVITARSYKEAINILDTVDNIDVIVTDVVMPDGSGFDIFHYVKARHPDIPVILLTAYGNVDSAVNAIKEGAFYYLVKPPDFSQLRVIMEKAVEQKRLRSEISLLKREISETYSFSNIIGKCDKMQRIFNLIETIKDSDLNALITGETGTGKELVAKAIHFNSRRSEGPFVTVNCTAIPQTLLESELFGFERGSFTSAYSRHIGKFERAMGGTIFLDEIGDLSLDLQSKLLRIIEEKEIERIGSNKKIKLDFRLLAATNKNLKEEVKRGNFREDLYYRLNVIHIKLPPLRDRIEDIPLLISHFIEDASKKEKKAIGSFSPEAMATLMEYHWPGNVRELANVISRCVLTAKGEVITLKDLPTDIRGISKKEEFIFRPFSKTSLKEIERELILNTLKKANWNKSKTAKMLGITRKSLYNRLKKFKLKE
ncbi:MAG: sigma-54 dependent transcriptional regulator [Nitrospirota bacterium]